MATLHGGAYDDFSVGTSGADVMIGGAGNDILMGEGGSDIRGGGAGDDMPFGEGGNDLLTGGNADDVLSGGSGNDTLVGGHGNDTFGLTGGSQDVVIDVEQGDDVLQIVRSINGLDIGSAPDVPARVLDVGGNAVIDQGGGDIITLMNVNAHDVHNKPTPSW